MAAWKSTKGSELVVIDGEMAIVPGISNISTSTCSVFSYNTFPSGVYLEHPPEEHCEYCRSRFHDDGKGRCLACGAPPGK